MQVSFVLRQFNASEELKELIHDKIVKRFEHLLNGESEVRVTLATEKSRTVLEITVVAWGEVFKSHETTTDLYPTIDLVLDKVERQIQKKKDMFQERRTAGRRA
ncbi:MAG TPA: ribosome-associated translation inhibitor RaiA [Myxococcota bacterium]|jgi:putative sigma-54 modulation protein|nr:ribosome-associated translation inhibitor RaiA [Myxococcota bacterium]